MDLLEYLGVFFISMVPVLELRLAMVMAGKWELNYALSLIIGVLGNMLPVPFIYFFARRVLEWGANKKYIGRFFRFCLRKGERAGQKLVAKGGRKGLFTAMLIFVGIPIPGTGAWTGTLAASFLNMGIKSTALSVSLGVVMAGCIMALISTGIFDFLGALWR